MMFRHSGYILYIYNNNYIYISYSLIRFSNICVCDVITYMLCTYGVRHTCGDIVVKKTTSRNARSLITPVLFPCGII